MMPNDLNLQRLKLAVVLPSLKECLLPVLGALAANPFADGCVVCSGPSTPRSRPSACSPDRAESDGDASVIVVFVLAWPAHRGKE